MPATRDGGSLTCPRCGRTLRHPQDVENRYCGHCHVFLDDDPLARAVELLEYALHLRMRGERAPGGDETWAQFDVDVEIFLRELRDPPDGDGDAFYAELGQRIRVARVNARMTQGALAEEVGLTRTSVTNVEAGRQRLPVFTLAAIELAVGVPSGSLLPRAAPGSGIPRFGGDR